MIPHLTADHVFIIGSKVEGVMFVSFSFKYNSYFI